MDAGLLDDVIKRLCDGGRRSRQVLLAETEVRQLCVASKDIFLDQPNLLELDAPIKICGDIFGQYLDLIRLFEYGGFPPSANYLFLGNYVNHGKQSLETICLLLAYKIKYPENFFLLRGNHECASVTRIHGFYDECKRRYNIRLWKTFVDCFNCLPVAAVIDDKILCVQGGLSPDLMSLNQIKDIPRPTDVPDEGLLCDLLWSDPARDQRGWGIDNDRSVSYTFGADKVEEFLYKHDLDLLCRGHQVVEDGYEFFANRQMVTIFSAPNFCGVFDNAGAMMNVDETLMCSFQILKPSTKEVAEKVRSTARSESLAAAPSEKLITPETPPARSIAQPVTPETLPTKNTPQKAVASPPHKNKTRPLTPARRRTSRSISPFRMNMSRPKTPPRKETQQPVTPHKPVASPPHKSKTRPVTPARRTSGSISPFRLYMSRPKTPPRKETQRPVTPETLPTKNTPQKLAASPPHKNKTRPITPTRRRTSRSISPFRLNILRPKTPPRKVTQRPVTPFRQ